MPKVIRRRRYYGGTDVVDVIETLAIERAKIFEQNLLMFAPLRQSGGSVKLRLMAPT